VRPFRSGFLLAALALSLVVPAPAAEIVIPPSPAQWATDTAGFLSPSALEAVNSQLRAYTESTGHQILVYIGKTTGGYPIEEFAVKTFEAWKPGRKGMDDGLIVFIMAADRKLRIEVGYGLEGVVTDAKSSRIINDILVPRIRAGDNDGAVKGAVETIFATIEGRPFGEALPVSEPSAAKANVPSLFIIIGIIILVIIFITNPSFALWLLINILSGGRGGGGFGGGRGGFGGGGGFRGGGGRSGGGGASGGW